MVTWHVLTWRVVTWRVVTWQVRVKLPYCDDFITSSCLVSTTPYFQYVMKGLFWSMPLVVIIHMSLPIPKDIDQVLTVDEDRAQRRAEYQQRNLQESCCRGTIINFAFPDPPEMEPLEVAEEPDKEPELTEVIQSLAQAIKELSREVAELKAERRMTA